MNRVQRTLVGASLVVVGMATLPALAGPASALGPGPGGAVSFVSPSGAAGRSDRSCSTAAFSTVQSAVDAATAGSTVVVCPGTYAESVTVATRITLRGNHDAVIDATGQPYGIGVNANGTTVIGLTVENASTEGGNAPGDGIITAGFGAQGPVPADHVTIVGTYTHDNEGAGVDLNSTSYSTAFLNDSENNGIGINMSDDLGVPASHNTIAFNKTRDNPGGCGIVLADHTGMGIFANTVVGNVADDNGLGTPSAPDASSGSGIILAGGAGGVYNNSVIGNEFSGNGHAGIAVHAHAPGMNMSGNVFAFNVIGTNNLRTDFADTYSTGIYIGDASPLTITAIGNVIHDDHYGIFTAGSITVRGAMLNLFHNVDIRTANVPAFG